MQKLKKAISLFLSLLLIFAVMAPVASAVDEERHEKSPIIFIAGNSVDICDADGNKISTGFEVLTDDDEGDISTEKIIETTMNILKPFILEGLPFDKWDNYGKALYEEFAPIWDESQLDGDGNAKYGTGVSKAEIEKWDKNATVDQGKDGKFGINDYQFRYDWRLSPYDHVDRLHEYIKTIINTTKCDQVCLVGRCLGGNVITAYLDKYGSEGLVKKAVYDEVMSNGSSVVNDSFSGQIDISDKHLQAYLLANEHFGKYNIGAVDFVGVNNLVLEMIESTLDLITQLGVTDALLTGVEALYSRLYKAFMPAVLKATGLGTWPSHWTSVYDEDLDAALDLIFGEEGTEERAENAGLVEKILYLRERIIKPRTLEGKENLYKRFADEYGVGIAVVAGYGLPIAPIGVHHDDTSDITVDTRNSSFGATTAGLFDTFSQEYIDERVAAGYGEYISPDRKIDASTCIFPETTWFVKNKHHDTGAGWWTIAEYYTQYTNVTATSNNKNISRFLVADIENGSKYYNMTEENMADGPWLSAVEQEPNTKTKLVALMRFLKVIFEFLTKLFNGEISLGNLFG